jgi:hypothetical protein
MLQETLINCHIERSGKSCLATSAETSTSWRFLPSVAMTNAQLISAAFNENT